MTDKEQIEYYVTLLDFLDDMIPCLDELIDQFDDEWDANHGNS